MTPQQARRRAARRIRRRRRKILARTLIVISILLAAAVLAGDVVEVSKEPAGADGALPRAPRVGGPPRPLQVPVPVFHPSILQQALELEIPTIDPQDLELRDPKIERLRKKRLLAQAEKKKPEDPKEAEQEEVPVPEEVRESLVHVSAVEPHLLEILPPRHFVEPAAVLISDLLPPPDPRWPVGWPGIAWVDFPLDPGGVWIVQPPPRKGRRDREEEEEEPPVIPEPRTAVLLLLGLLAIGLTHRRPSTDRLD